MSAILSCTRTLADGEYFFPEPITPTAKLINPIYLDTSHIKKTVTNTSIPFNIRGEFDEADYFSSSAYDVPPAEPPPKLNLSEIPSPSEYKTVNSIAKEIKELPATYKPEQNENKFFLNTIHRTNKK